MSQPTILRVARRGSRWHFILVPPGDLLMRPAYPAFETQIDPDLLQLLCSQMIAAVHLANASPTRNKDHERRFVQIGRALFAALFPDGAAELRQHLRNLTTPLLVVSDDREVPWECLFVLGSEEPDGFLGMRADIGRGLVATSVPNLPVLRRHRRWRCLVVANPTRDLDANEEEALQLEKWFVDRGFRCKLLCGTSATMEAVVGELLEEWDVIHFSGHVDPDSSSLVLSDGMLTPLAIQPLLRGAPIAFINGCESASVEMLTEAFIRGGVQAVIGSLYKLPPDGAAAFSRKFYESVLQGEKLGAAVRSARQHVHRNIGGAAWACFVLFGDPCLKAQVERDPLEDALRHIGLDLDSFDQEAGLLIREAYRFGHPVGAITSGCILAGLFAVNDPLLLERLSYFRVPPDSLDRAFRSTFTLTAEAEGPKQGDTEAELAFSDDAANWLKASRESGEAKITRSAIYRAWVRSGGGGAGLILRQLGVPLESLDPDRPFPPKLEKIGPLAERHCGSRAWRVLQQAVGMAGSSGARAVSSVHIAAAMQGQSTSLLSARLNQAGVHVDLREWFPRGDAAQVLAGVVPCSKTINAILELASRKAQVENRPITEEDLFEAFLHSGGGSVGKALDERGVWRKLAESLVKSPDDIQSVGPIGQEGSTPNSWTVLLSAAEFAGNAGRNVVSTFDLLAGLQADPDGGLQRRLTRLGINVQLRSWVQPVGPCRVFIGQVPCSENVNRALLLAQARAAADAHPVDEVDLLQAFIESGGGRAGQQFEKNCCLLQTLTSELFVNGGALNLDRLDSDAQTIVQRAVEFAGEKGWPSASRDHLAFALIGHGGYFTSRLRCDGLSPEQMGDLAFNYLSNAPSHSGSRALNPDLRSFGGDLVRILCRAESQAGHGHLISERDLASAWAGGGGGRFGQVLVEHNFRLRRLIDEPS